MAEKHIFVGLTYEIIDEYKTWLEEHGATKQESFAYAQGLQDFFDDPKTVRKFFVHSHLQRGNTE
jgi:hypothetical protein